ncbi:MAG: ACT domain-containing protein [Clostridiales bacterium]|nr:ACT domain-containing protein [Clostridiales bacterium]
MTRKDDEKYYMVKKRALPEVLLKVVEAKRLLETKSSLSVQEATEAVDISRSSFYKYKDDIFPFHDNARGKTITFMIQMEDTPGLLSVVLNQVARHLANILTIHQSIPVNGVASLTLSVEICPDTGDVTKMLDDIESLDGIHSLKILARE